MLVKVVYTVRVTTDSGINRPVRSASLILLDFRVNESQAPVSYFCSSSKIDACQVE